jgi:hypothetical protein
MRFLVSAALLALTTASHAILIRPDRDDAEYLEMATKFTSFVSFAGSPGAGGVLVHPRWILTSAPTGQALAAQKGRVVRMGGRNAAIERVVLHPAWKGTAENGLALVLLAEAVRGVEPTPIYTAQDEAGKTVVIVGAGSTGKIGDRPAASDGKPRASVNTVDKVGSLTLSLQLKDKDNASDLQGAAAPGDSGGPAYVNTPEGLRVIGIGYATDDTNGNGIVGDLGDWEIYARASSFREWIENTMLDVAREEARRLLEN